MRTKMDYSSLGESKTTYSNTPSSATYSQVGRETNRTSTHTTHSSVREQRQIAAPAQNAKQHGSSNRTSAAGRREESGRTLGVAMGLLAGASVGVLAGILMAPDSGRITRRRLSDSAAWVGRGINEKLGTGKGKVDSWVGSAGKAVNQAAHTIKKTVSGTGKEL